MRTIKVTAFCTALALTGALGATMAGEPLPELPETFHGVVAMIGGGGSAATHRIRITIDRWTTPEERHSLLTALDKGGQKGLLDAMKPIEVGWITVDEGLRYRLRTAVTFMNDKGRVIRVTTDRPIEIGEAMHGFRSLDYPFGVAEFTLPSNGKSGTGSLVFAAQAGFGNDGRLQVATLPGTTSPQRLMGMEKQVDKKAKKKKKDKGKDAE